MKKESAGTLAQRQRFHATHETVVKSDKSRVVTVPDSTSTGVAVFCDDTETSQRVSGFLSDALATSFKHSRKK